MLSTFKSFILEAAEEESTASRVIAAIERQLPKLLGSKLYRYGGKSGRTADGVLYFFGSNSALQIRMKNDAIKAFDIWEKFTLDGAADYTIHTEKVPVAIIAKQLKDIVKIIKNPTTGKVELQVNEEAARAISFEDAEDLFEAKTVSPEEFLALAKKTLGDDGVKSVTFNQIKSIATDNKVGVPNKAWLDKQKIGRGLWTLIPGGASEATGGHEVDTSTGKPKPTLYVKVTAQDPITKRFLSAGESKEAQALYKQIQDSMSMNSKPTEEEMRDVDSLFGHLYELSELAAKGKLTSLIIYGGPGTGKTVTVMEAIKNAHLVKGRDYVKISGKISPIELYKTLFLYRKGGLVLFDDCDSMWGDKDASNYLKAALDTSKVREISSVSSRMKNVSKWDEERREAYNDELDKLLNGEEADEDEDDDEGNSDIEAGKIKFPSVFDFTGRVIFISNLAKNQLDSAVLSRSAKIDMTLTPEEMLKRMKSILPKLGGDDIPLKIKEEIIEVLLDLSDKEILDAITMRDFVKVANIYRSGSPNWKRLAEFS